MIYVLTRFNVINCWVERFTPEYRVDRLMKARRFDEEWLRRRVKLFSKYTYPSMLSQTSSDFKWLGFVHKDSPKWFIDVMRTFSLMDVVLCETDLDEVPRGEATVNLDSDDMLARNFIAELKDRLPVEGAVCFRRGMRYKVETNAFCYIESNRNPFACVVGEQTVFDLPHGCWEGIKVISDCLPMWLQIIHGDNIDNKFKKPRKNKLLSLEVAQQYFDIGGK